jgi:hypothetical protein
MTVNSDLNRKAQLHSLFDVSFVGLGLGRRGGRAGRYPGMVGWMVDGRPATSRVGWVASQTGRDF